MITSRTTLFTLSFFLVLVVFPSQARANEEGRLSVEAVIEDVEIKGVSPENSGLISEDEYLLAPTGQAARLEPGEKVSGVRVVSMTAYNSEVAQTDASPCITANGFNVCKHGVEDTVAANFLPFGTKIRIPDYFGDRIFVVRDRMNRRYQNRVDVWMKQRSDALKFGVRSGRIEIVK